MFKKIIKTALISSLLIVFIIEVSIILSNKGNVKLHIETFGMGDIEIIPLDFSFKVNDETLIETVQLTYGLSIDTVLMLPIGLNKLEFISKDRNVKYETYAFNLIFLWYSFTLFEEKAFFEERWSIFRLMHI